MTQVEASPRLDDYLSHMLEAARLARRYVQNLTKSEFLQDRRTQQAVVFNLLTIGEAAGRIVGECKEFAAAHPEIPWAPMRGMRNRMVHGYFDIDLNIVWDTVQSSLPELERLLQVESDERRVAASLPAPDPPI
jgi:uncharacterized protein with HEPN domain